MKNRCYDVKNKSYSDYGGRGITVCDKWVESFDNFIADMGLRPANKRSLDRIDNNKGYSAENCRWADSKEQNNNKRNNILIDINGRRKSIMEWAEYSGLNYKLIYRRHKEGKTGAEVIKSDKYGTYYFGGVGKTLGEWSDETGIKKTTILQRLKYGWTIKKTLTVGSKSNEL
tara:strand:- start:10 stop:525 length:516 start_codon:yes stop_codon:yes gene_type:complete